MKSKYLLITMLLGLYACQPKSGEQAATEPTTDHDLVAMNNLLESEAGQIVAKAIEHCGGWNQWTKTTTLSFIKRIQHHDSSGAVDREVSQLHQYQLRPQFKARLTWKQGNDDYMIINNGQSAWMYINGVEAKEKDKVNLAWNSSYGSHYVICMPFKLADPGTILAYDGIDTLSGGQVVHNIKVDYEEGAGSTGGMHHWRYFFDKDTYEPVANYLDYGEGHSYTEYGPFYEVENLIANKWRKSYSSNPEEEKILLRTTYNNDDLQYNVDLDPELFEPLAQPN
ncbi:MAG: DUF6503 family protein [Cyclobacteriaceae bacterium]